MKESHRIWLAVPPDEKDEAIKAHPRMENGQNAIVWDPEHRLWYARPGTELDKFERWLPRPHELSMSSSDPVTEFAQVLEDAGLVLKGLPVMNGSLQRVPTRQDKKGSKSGAYKGFMDGRPAGWYRDYRSADEKPTQWVFSGGNDIDPLARLHLRAHSQQTREDNLRVLEQQYNRQAEYASRYVSSLPQADTNPYLTRKGVQAATGVRINPNGELVIPFSNSQGQVRSYQRIPETGGKDARILKDSEKTGNWFPLGTPVNGLPLLFAEGYATAASLHEATGLPVLMTIDAGNMIAVAQNARAVWPDSPFIFCADNDHQLKNTQTGEPENKGIISAKKAAALANGQIIVPEFTPAELDLKLTDFNDLDVSRGRAAFHQEINVRLISMGVTTPFSEAPQIRAALTPAGDNVSPIQETTMAKEETTSVTPVLEKETTPQPSIPEVTPEFTTAPITTDSASQAMAATPVIDQDINWQEVIRDVASGLGVDFQENTSLSDMFSGLTALDALTTQSGSEPPTPGTTWSDVIREVAVQQGIDIPANATPEQMAEILNGQNTPPVIPSVSESIQPDTPASTDAPATEDLSTELTPHLPDSGSARIVQDMAASGANTATQDNPSVLTDTNVIQPLSADLQVVYGETGPGTTSSLRMETDTPHIVTSDEPVEFELASQDEKQPAVAVAQAVSPALATEQGKQAMQDYARIQNLELDAATLLQKAETDPAYKAGLIALFDQQAQELKANGRNIDVATFAETAMRDLASEARFDARYAQQIAVEAAPQPIPASSTEPDNLAPVEASLDPTVIPSPATKQAELKKPDPEVLNETAQSADSETATAKTTVPPGTEPPPREEADGIVYGPRRPDAPTREDLEQIIRSLSTEEQKDKTVLYRVDGLDAFRDLGNRLEMCDGASQDDRRVLAALAVAAKFYGGVIELTGSNEFKEKAMRLIIENELDIRMKNPAQRAQLDELRKKMGATNDAVVTHMPTPDLNRQTSVEPPVQMDVPASPAVTPQTNVPAPPSPAEPQQPLPPGKATAPVPPGVEQPAAPATQTELQPLADAPPSSHDAIQVEQMPAEPAPTVLAPGQSVTAVLMNYGEATYENKEQRGNSFFVELQNRGGSHTYWGQDLKALVQNHKVGDVVTLTLKSRDTWMVPGDDKERVKNNWSMVPVQTGLAVPHSRPEQGQNLISFPVDTFGSVTQQIRQAWPDYTSDLKIPSRFEDRSFYFREDRHPVPSPQGAAEIAQPVQGTPSVLTPVMASMNEQEKRMDLLLVQSAGEHFQGMVRLNGTLYPALATPTADNKQLVINAITDNGPRYAGYGQAVNFEPDGTTRTSPQLMSFHLKGREDNDPLHARLYTPEKQDAALFQRLGFEQNWTQWEEARKPEGRQEKTLHQEYSHSPGR